MSRHIELRQPVRASPLRVWRALADPDGMTNWQADEVHGTMAPGERLELRWPALGASVEVRVVAVQTGRLLVMEADGSRLTVSLEPGCVHLLQEGLTSEDEAAGAASSWQVSLAVLAHYLERHDGKERHVSWFVRPVATAAETAHAFFTEPAALRTWLTESGGIGETDSAVALRLAWGDALTGRVLCHARERDLAVSWNEQDGSVLVLRTLPSPRSSDERLVATVWSRWGAAPDPYAVRELGLALERLGRLLDGAGSA